MAMFLNKEFVSGGTIGALNFKEGNYVGVYLVVLPDDFGEIKCDKSSFNERSKVEKYKNKDPSVSIDKLKEKWVDGAKILYIGKHEKSVKRRMQEHYRFWSGEPVPAYGGRIIGQIKNYENLEVWYLPCDNPKQTERDLIDAFIAKYGKLPFANWKRGDKTVISVRDKGMHRIIEKKCIYCGKKFQTQVCLFKCGPSLDSEEENDEEPVYERCCNVCRRCELMVIRNRKKEGGITNAMKYGGRIKDWKKWIDNLPEEGGVYIVYRESAEPPVFLEKGTGGLFHGKDPNVPLPTLQEKWEHSDHRYMYVGRANYNIDDSRAQTCKKTIRDRVKEFIRFGKGNRCAHWGGRYIWQMKDSDDLHVWYKSINYPQSAESVFIAMLDPFANLKFDDKI